MTRTCTCAVVAAVDAVVAVVGPVELGFVEVGRTVPRACRGEYSLDLEAEKPDGEALAAEVGIAELPSQDWTVAFGLNPEGAGDQEDILENCVETPADFSVEAVQSAAPPNMQPEHH